MRNFLFSIMFLIASAYITDARAENVCMIGDSIVVGIGDRGKYWRARIKALRPDVVFVGRYFDGIYWHDGVGGDKTTDVLARINTITGCETAILHVGGNDLLAGVTGGVVSQNVKAIADALTAKGISVRIDTILPLNSTASGAAYWNSVISWTNDRIREQAAGLYTVTDTWQVFVSLGGGTPNGAGLYYDAVHQSYTGSYVLAQYVAPRL